MNILLLTHLSLNLYSIGFLLYFFSGIIAVFYIYYKYPALDRSAFFIYGTCLILFTLCRPLTLSRDDTAYISIVESICSFNDCGLSFQSSRDWLWYLSIAILKSFASDSFALLSLAAISIAIKLFIVDYLCKQRMAALILLIPLIYIQYDFTQLRAGLAISWYLIGILFLIKKRNWLASSFMASNFILHTQALLSLTLMPIAWLNCRKWILPIWVTLFVTLIYIGLYPNLSHIGKWHIIETGISPYLAMAASGMYHNVKGFPIGYLPILGYALWLTHGVNPQKDPLTKTVGASIALAIFLTWLFSFNPTIQTRTFEFYIAPLVILAGNIGSSKAKLISTAALAAILYLRLEFLHDWILG